MSAISKNVKNTIESANTVEKVWALVSSLLSDGNGYTDQAYLDNARAYTAIALGMIANGQKIMDTNSSQPTVRLEAGDLVQHVQTGETGVVVEVSAQRVWVQTIPETTVVWYIANVEVV